MTSCHLLNYECGSPAALSGVLLHTLQGENGIFSFKDVQKAIRPRLYARSKVLVEQTSNLGGGAIWPLETIDAVAEEAKTAGLVAHMDGARLMNAVVKTDISASRYAQNFDSVWISLSPPNMLFHYQPRLQSSIWSAMLICLGSPCCAASWRHLLGSAFSTYRGSKI